MILKDAYNFYSSKLFLHPYNSKVLQRLAVSERVSRHQVTARWGFAFRTWHKSLLVFQISASHSSVSVLGLLTCSCPPRFTCGVIALNGTIGKELDLSQGSHLKLAGFKTLSQAVHRQEEEAGGGGGCPQSCLFLAVPRACPCSTCRDDKWKSYDTLLVLRLLCFSRIVVTR